jgi:hypothetical protein
VSRTFGKTRRGVIALAILVAIAPAVAAQSITDARRVEFTPSTDHNAVDSATGAALVQRYSLQMFLAGGTTALQTVDLGKPTPEADGMIRVDFVALLGTPLTPGVIYESVVSSVGPGGSAASARSNTFSFSAPCATTVSPASQWLAAAGGTASTTVGAGTGCAWTAASNAAWITVTAGAAGTGAGTATFSVAANTGTTSRTGTVTIAGATFTVTQASTPCAFTISPTSQSLATAGGSGTVTVTTTAGCNWTATSGASWVTITSGATGSGSGSVGFTAASNTTTQARTATLTIAGKSFLVTEPSASCTFSVSPLVVTVPQGGATGSIAVTTQSACAWTASTTASWITLAGSRTGSGSATYTIGANPGSTSRSALVSVAGVVVRVNQNAGTAPKPPSNLRVIK